MALGNRVPQAVHSKTGLDLAMEEVYGIRLYFAIFFF